MKLKKAYKKYAAKPTFVNEVLYNHALDVWRSNKININFIAKDHPDHQTAFIFNSLLSEAIVAQEIIRGDVLLKVKDKTVKVYVKGQKKPIGKLERKVFNAKVKRTRKTFEYKLWVVAKYLT